MRPPERQLRRSRRPRRAFTAAVGLRRGLRRRRRRRRRRVLDEVEVVAIVNFILCRVDGVLVLVMNAARPKHEPIHAHAQVVAVGLEALPHEHAGTALTRDAARAGRDGEAL